MKYACLFLLFICGNIQALTMPDLLIDGAVDNTLLYGYKVNVYSGSGEMLFNGMEGFIISQDYVACLTPVLYGVNSDGTHITGGGIHCYIIRSPK